MVDQISALLGLPFEVLALISAGYLAYRIAYTGNDQAHSTIDTVFLTFVYAFVAQVAAVGWGLFGAAMGWEATPRVGAVIGLLCALISAGIWRKWGEEAAFEVLRRLGVSSADRHASAWHSILARGSKRPSQLIVKKTDGTMLMCERLADFEKAPLGPCLLGEDGSVALYVTDSKALNGDWTEQKPYDPERSDWGYLFTYVPTAQIAEIRLRSVA